MQQEVYTQPSTQIPVTAHPQVLVLGSGPAGFSAAIAAGRAGAKTLLVEQCGVVGGIATAGLMSHWTGTVDDALYREILQRSADANEDWDGICKRGEITISIDPEKLKTLLLQMLEEAGVELLLYTFVSDAITQDGEIRGVVIENKSGRQAIFADIVIDCTGDGDAAAKAGVPYRLGRESDGKMQPATLMFKIGGVDYSRAVFLNSFESTYETPNGELQSLARQHLPHPAGHILTYRSTLPGVVTCNMTNCTDIDGTRTEDLTRAERVCRSQMEAIVAYLRKFVPGYERCFILSSASLIGVRETRHFQGEYTLTQEDILAAREFEDWVVRGAHFNFDIHNVEGAGLDAHGAQKYFTQEKGYTIPYRCLLPVGVERLLLAGRNISGTHVAHSNYRVMPICVGMGHAAGTAAALAVQKAVTPRQISAKQIQQILEEESPSFSL